MSASRPTQSSREATERGCLSRSNRSASRSARRDAAFDFFGWFIGGFISFLFVLGKHRFAAEPGKNGQFLLLAFMFDQDTISPDAKQFNRAQLIALFDHAGLALGRTQKSVLACNPEQGHRHWPHHLAEDFALNNPVNPLFDFR